MSAHVKTLKLTPLDLIMPNYYTRLALSFRTGETVERLLPKLHDTLTATSHSLSWLRGKVYRATESVTRKAGLEVRWHEDDECPTLVDLGMLPGSYEDAAGSRMPLTTIPSDKWPIDAIIPDQLHNTGAPVLAAGILSFADGGGVILCVCLHHNVVDAGGFAEVLRIWTNIINGAPSTLELDTLDRNDRLCTALGSYLESASSSPVEVLLQSHFEYTTGPPQIGKDIGQCTSTVLIASLSKVEDLKAKVGKYTTVPPTTNTIICAVVWCAITRTRQRREPTPFPPESKSRLGMAVNGRARIAPDFSTVDEPYFGNVNLYALAELQTDQLSEADGASTESLPQICDAIVASNSSNKINSRHVAEVCSFVSRLHEPLSPGWTLFGGLDLAITSWANLGIYDMSFGDSLGRPEFVRVPHAEIDSLAIILPRKRSSVVRGSGDVIEIVMMLRRDDYEVLKADEVWNVLTDDEHMAA